MQFRFMGRVSDVLPLLIRLVHVVASQVDSAINFALYRPLARSGRTVRVEDTAKAGQERECSCFLDS